MFTLLRTTALATLANLGFALASPALASAPKALLIAPPHDDCFELPKFGFSSYNIGGFGEQVTYVRWGGRAAQLGLEPGDIILSLNGYQLTYHGAWNDALRHAMHNGGWVQLAIRDVRTGDVAFRQTYLRNYGIGPVTPHVVAHSGYFPTGPLTTKQFVPTAPQLKMTTPGNIKKLAELIEHNP
jgi:hypothetical protein